MRDIRFRAWHKAEQKMYYRAYQKLLHVLLCDDDQGRNEGKGTPVKRASFEDCLLLETTSLKDKNGREIFEGDILRVKTGKTAFTGVVPEIPDMFRSRGLHPLHELLSAHGVPDDVASIELEVIGNRFETPALLADCR